MAGNEFLTLATTDDRTRFDLTVRKQLCVGPPGRLFLFGGAGLASGLAAAEAVTGRPTVWAAAHYLSYAHPDEHVTLHVDECVRGNAVSQVRVTARTPTREVLMVSAALGTRGKPQEGQWTRAPQVPEPDQCPPRPMWPHRDADDLHGNLEVRVVQGRMGIGKDGQPSVDGRSIFWARPKPGLGPIDLVWTCIIADFVPSGLSHALGLDGGGNSLDNTIRFRKLVPTGWLLCDVQIHSVHDGFAHGRMHMFAEDGTLVATASQSMIVRLWGE